MTVIVPSLRHERRLWNEGLVRVVGVDEVGVAPTCGAVVAAAVIMRPGCHRIPGVRDSKTLSMAQRERLAPLIRARAVAVGVGAASVREIDLLNIYHATHLAMRRAIARVGGHEHVLVDGNRIAGFEAQVGPYTNIVDGDAKVYSIACASVVAKVVRDRMMTKLATRYPGTAGSTTRATRRATTATRSARSGSRRSIGGRSWPSSGPWRATSSTSTCWRTRRPRPRRTTCSSASSCRSWPTTPRSTRPISRRSRWSADKRGRFFAQPRDTGRMSARWQHRRHGSGARVDP